MVSTLSFMPEFKTDRIDPEVGPRLMVGAASPLWLMYGSAAAAGAAWWWWASRWREAVNLEALGLPISAPAPETVVEAVAEAATQPLERMAEATVETLDAVEAIAETSAAAVVEMVDEVVEAAPAPLEAVAEVEAVAKEAAAELVTAVEPQAAVDTLVEAVVEAPVDAVAAAATVVADDLTRLVGIGPKLAVSLSDLGVTSFSQIAAWSADDLKSIDQLLNLKGRADRDAWIAQAKRFAGSAEA